MLAALALRISDLNTRVVTGTLGTKWGRPAHTISQFACRLALLYLGQKGIALHIGRDTNRCRESET